MNYLKFVIIGLLLSLMSTIIYAQQGEGQVCVRAFEDRNGNSTFDANEPLITQGIGVNLLNALGVTIDSKLLGDSPTAAQGVACFQQLGIGDYTVIVTSADYSAVTPTSFSAMVVAGSVPVRFDFGGQLLSNELTSTTNTSSISPAESQTQTLQGILFGVIGAIIVMGILVIIGMLIYFGVFRRRLNRIPVTQGTGAFRPVTGAMPAFQPTPTTGSMPAVQPNNPLLNRDPNEGSPLLFSDEDTDQMGTVKG